MSVKDKYLKTLKICVTKTFRLNILMSSYRSKRAAILFQGNHFREDLLSNGLLICLLPVLLKVDLLLKMKGEKKKIFL